MITAEPGVIEDKVTVGAVFIYPSQYSSSSASAAVRCAASMWVTATTCSRAS